MPFKGRQEQNRKRTRTNTNVHEMEAGYGRHSDQWEQTLATSSEADDLLADCPDKEHEERLFKSALNRESLPTLSDMCWLSRVDSISALLANYAKIYDAVAQVKAQSKGRSSHNASGFLHGMEQFQFIISAVLTQHVLGCTRHLSVLLQSTCDLVKAHIEARSPFLPV